MKSIILVFVILFTQNLSFAQSNDFFSNTKNVSLQFNDAPIRTALEQLLKMGNINNYVISNDVEGFVTLNLTEQKFENALKIIMRANNMPLLYKIENKVLIIEKRKILESKEKMPEFTKFEEQKNDSFQIIKLNHIDPLDLSIVLGQILNIKQFTRYNFNFGAQGNRNR